MNLAEAIRRTVGLLEILDRMTLGDPAAWTQDRHPRTVLLRRQADPVDMFQELEAIAPLVRSATLTGRFGGSSIRLTIAHDSEAIVADTSGGDLSDSFGLDLIDVARDAWAGDVQKAIQLPGDWVAEATVEPTALLAASRSDVDWYLFDSVDDAVRLLETVPFWRLAELLMPGTRAVWLVRELEPGSRPLRCQVLMVAPLDTSLGKLLDDWHGEIQAAEAVTPTSLRPSGDHAAPFEPLYVAILRLAAALVWQGIATSSEIALSQQHTTLEFFGLQRVVHDMPWLGPAIDVVACLEAVDLHDWFESANSTDRLLAIRQVASLRSTAPPWTRPEEIRRASEPIFMALRNDAVAETIRAQREVKSGAVAAAQRTAELTASLAKGAVERSLASMLAIGGVIVARSTSALSDAQAEQLRLLVAIALVALAIWNVVIERPPLFRIAADFKSDLPVMNELLSEAEQRRILDLKALSSARLQALIASITIPAVYVMAAITALLLS